MKNKKQQLEQHMTIFCDEFRLSDKGRSLTRQPIINAQRLADIRTVLQEAGQLVSQPDFQVETDQLNSLMEQTKRCLKAIDRQQMMAEATENIRKVTDVINENYGPEANRVMSARKAYEQSRQQPTTDLSSLDGGKPDDE